MVDAFRQLNIYDVVIGPATDGGYYLLGLNKPQPAIFKNITWSTNQVFSETVKACSLQRLSTGILEELADIDTEDDLRKFTETNSWLND